MGRIIVVASGKGGVGKTTLTANLGIALAKKKKSVCVIDGDFGLNNLDSLLGLENRVVYDVFDILKGECRISQGLVKDPIFNNLYMLASTKIESNRCVQIEDFKGLVMELEKVFDYCLIDAPAGLDFGFVRALAPAGEMLVVVTPTVASIRDAVKCVSLAKSKNEIMVNVVVNRVRWNLISLGEMLSVQDIEELINEKVIGVIPENGELLVGNTLKGIMQENNDIVAIFDLLADNLIHNRYVIADGTKKIRGIWGGFFKKRKEAI